MTYTVESLGDECLINAAKTSMSSKLIGSDSEFFSKMVVDAANAIKMSDGKGGHTYPIKGTHFTKSMDLNFPPKQFLQTAQKSVCLNAFIEGKWVSHFSGISLTF